jgi:GT2 family glycosyltransferase
VKVSILVHNLNRAHDLRRCLASISRLTYRPLELVILDAGSSDGSLDVIRDFEKELQSKSIEVRFVPCELMGVAESRNFAARFATGTLLVFIDNDACFDQPDAIQRIIKRFEASPDLGLLAFRLLDHEKPTDDPLTWVYRRPSERWASIPFLTFTFAGAGFCIRASVFTKLGGFWSKLHYSREEEDLAMGIIHAGFKILYSPDLVVRHFPNPKGRFSIAERRRIELRNGILVIWRRFPIPIALVAGGLRALTMSAKMTMRRQGSPFHLLSVVATAVSDLPATRSDRATISLASLRRYVLLHFSSAYDGRLT